MDIALEELRLELSDLKHSLDGTKVDLQLMDEKIRGQESSLKSQLTNKTQAKGAELSLQLANFERKLSELSSHANQTSATFTKLQDRLRDMEQEIQAQNRRLDEVVKLKGTLSSLSQVLKEKSKEESFSSSSRKYKIKSGDSLEKIAKQQGTSVDAIKKLNGLDSDRIVVGQEIRLPE